MKKAGSLSEQAHRGGRRDLHARRRGQGRESIVYEPSTMRERLGATG